MISHRSIHLYESPIDGVEITPLQALPGRSINHMILPWVIVTAQGRTLDEVFDEALRQIVDLAKQNNGDAVLALSVQVSFEDYLHTAKLAGCVVKLVPQYKVRI